MAILTLKSTVKEFIDLISPKSPCEESIKWINSANKEDDSIETMVNNFIATPQAEAPQGWVRWLMKEYSDSLDDDTRMKFLQKVTDMMTAFHIYKESSILSTADISYLEKMFKNKLPIMESSYVRNIV